MIRFNCRGIYFHRKGLVYCWTQNLIPRYVNVKNKMHTWNEQYKALDMHYRVIKGTSSLPPVVICHGMLGSHQNWTSIGKRIYKETNRSVYLPDMRNHGNSPHSNDMTYYDMASDVDFFIKKHNLDKVVLIGHSMGGRTALLLSLLNPDIIDQLVVVDSSPIHRTTDKGIKDIEIFLNAISKVDMSNITKQNMDRRNMKMYLDETLKENGIRNESRRQWLIMNLISTTNINGVEEYDWNFNLKTLKQSFLSHLILLPQEVLKSNIFSKNTFFIGSPISNYIPQDSHDEIKKYFPLAEFIYVPGASHWIQADKPKEFIKIVLQFLKRLPSE